MSSAFSIVTYRRLPALIIRLHESPIFLAALSPFRTALTDLPAARLRLDIADSAAASAAHSIMAVMLTGGPVQQSRHGVMIGLTFLARPAASSVECCSTRLVACRRAQRGAGPLGRPS